MTTKPIPTASQVAEVFAAYIRSYLTEDELATVNELNAEERGSGVCHTHDFCDANDAMLGAFVNFGLNAEDESLHQLWCDAWDIAIGNKFWA